MSLFAYVLTRIRVFFDAFTRFVYARFLRIFWFAYLRAALYASSIYFERKCYVLASQMEPLHSICKSYVMWFFVSKNKNGFNIVST